MMTFDATRYRQKIRELRNVLYDAGEDSDLRTILKDEARRLITLVVKFTPPLGPGGKSSGAKQAGERAIERELKSLFGEVSPELAEATENKYGRENIDGYIEANGRPMRIQWDHLEQSPDALQRWHNQYRGKRGKVPLVKSESGIWKKRVIVPQGSRKLYIEKEKLRVGRWKASVAAALPFLGGRVPRWISRHFTDVRSISILDLSQMDNRFYPSITFGTRAPGTGEPDYDYRSKFQAAIRSRTRSISRRINLLIKVHCAAVNGRQSITRRAEQTNTEAYEELDEE